MQADGFSENTTFVLRNLFLKGQLRLEAVSMDTTAKIVVRLVTSQNLLLVSLLTRVFLLQTEK